MRRAARLAVALLVAGCASGGAPLATAPANAGEWVRRIAPFPVADETGAAYAEPFLGGFNVPRPQLVDIDGDGDDDLMVQEATGSVMFFERRPGPGMAYA